MALAILAGAFIAMGANFATTVWAGLATGGVPFGLQRLVGGLVFATGLIMVVIGGSELFTGNCLIPMAWASKKVSTGAMLRKGRVVRFNKGKFPFDKLIREYPASEINTAVKDSLDGVTIKPVLRF